MASVTLDTGSRIGELCAIRLEDLSPALEEIRIVRRPQNARPGDPVSVEVYPLRRGEAEQRSDRRCQREQLGSLQRLLVEPHAEHPPRGTVDDDLLALLPLHDQMADQQQFRRPARSDTHGPSAATAR
ncbi:hypothetical protein [Streptomyces sp. NPDC000229]|uniref:hypothetical protein n=1 Tax=Streptomyces sp. NPDC000229 TaxID=3154247 RepID=UPI00332A0C87